MSRVDNLSVELFDPNTIIVSLVPRLPDLINVSTCNIEKLGMGPWNEANLLLHVPRVYVHVPLHTFSFGTMDTVINQLWISACM